MKRLALKYEINKMSVLYEETTASWNNAEFTLGKDFSARLKLWEDGVEPDQISETLKKLEKRAESFRVAMKYLGNHNVVFMPYGFTIYYFHNEEFFLKGEKDIAEFTDFVRRGKLEQCNFRGSLMPFHVNFITSVTTSPASLPTKMPIVPYDLHRISETIVAADELSKYPDLVIKLAYLVLEELEPTPPDEFRYSRNFVSHTICKDSGVITFVESELSSAGVPDGVQFRRNDKEHMAFVAKYAYPALQRAKELFNEKVKTQGGFL